MDCIEVTLTLDFHSEKLFPSVYFAMALRSSVSALRQFSASFSFPNIFRYRTLLRRFQKHYTISFIIYTVILCYVISSSVFVTPCYTS